MSFDLKQIRKDFPILSQTVHGLPLVYLDNAATAQKPRVVIDAEKAYYEHYCANINRGAHRLSERATAKYQESRACVAAFLGAKKAEEIVFVRSTTEAINLVAHGLGKSYFKPGDEIILTEMEHHANIVPWYILAKEKGLKLRVAPVNNNGELDQKALLELFNKNSKLLAISQASNATGIINPLKEIVRMAKAHAVPILVDGAQGLPHLGVDVSDLDVDFYAFSGHKAYGPTGIGALYAKSSWLERMPPYQSGGDMIVSVAFDDVIFAQAPQKFEAGTPNIAGALGLAAAINYIRNIGLENIHEHERALHAYAREGLLALKQLKICGDVPDKISLISFAIDGVHPHDVSSVFDRQGIAIRAGHLCAEPLVRRFGQRAFSRASFAFYNSFEEVDAFVHAFSRLFEIFKL
jgi:cysteine desulfurase/selenocysteine lyase